MVRQETTCKMACCNSEEHHAQKKQRSQKNCCTVTAYNCCIAYFFEQPIQYKPSGIIPLKQQYPLHSAILRSRQMEACFHPPEIV